MSNIIISRRSLLSFLPFIPATAVAANTAIAPRQLGGPNNGANWQVAVRAPSATNGMWGQVGSGLSVSAQGVISASPSSFTLATPVDGEIPSGAPNGSNVTFTLLNVPNMAYPAQVFVNGVKQSAQNGDYTIAGNTITFTLTNIPQTGDTVNVSYWH